MQEQWSALPLFEKIFWGVAVISTFLFLVQSLLSIVTGDDGDAVGDADGAVGGDNGVGGNFFTIKNMVVFFTLFGWSGLACIHNGLGQGLTVVVATICGAALVGFTMWLLLRAQRLKHSGTLSLKNAIGLTGTTYLVIPSSRTGTGKVHLRVQGALRELDAITDDAEPAATGSLVKVSGVIDGRILLVSRNLQ